MREMYGGMVESAWYGGDYEPECERTGMLVGANLSPEIVGGEIRWYYGDTFRIQILLSMVDVDGEPVRLLPGDEVQLTLRDRTKRVMDMGNVTGDLAQGIITWELSREKSLDLERGKYTLTVVVLHDGDYRTIMADAPVWVR